MPTATVLDSPNLTRGNSESLKNDVRDSPNFAKTFWEQSHDKKNHVGTTLILPKAIGIALHDVRTSPNFTKTFSEQSSSYEKKQVGTTLISPEATWNALKQCSGQPYFRQNIFGTISRGKKHVGTTLFLPNNSRIFMRHQDMTT